MKFILTILLGSLLMGVQLQAQEAGKPMFSKKKSTRKSPMAQASKKIDETLTVDIQYGSPAVKGRKIWGDLVPFNEVWRTGANEATTFEVSQDVLIEGQKLEAGRYSLFTIPSEGKWTVIFNKVADQWGAYNYNPQEDALRIEVNPKVREESAERLFINIEDEGEVNIIWEQLAISFIVAKAD